jgi:hypothetical protein
MVLAAAVKNLSVGNKEKLRRKSRHQGLSKVISKVTPTRAWNFMLPFALFSGIV